MQFRPEFLPAGFLLVLCIAANIVLYPSVGSMVVGTPQSENKDNFSAKILQELKSFQNRYIPVSTQDDAAPDKPASQDMDSKIPNIKQPEETKTLNDRDPFAKFVNENEIQDKVTAPAEIKPTEDKPAENKSVENKSDAAAKLYDKNIDNGTSNRAEPLVKPAPKEPQRESDAASLPSITALSPQNSQPVYANQVKQDGTKETEIIKVSRTVAEKSSGKNNRLSGSVKKLPEWETVDSVLNTPVMYDTPSAVISFPPVENIKND